MKQIKKMKTIEILHPISASKIRIPRIEQRQGIALKLEDLTIGYGKKMVAKEISLEIERGEHIAVLGDNGQGKSTLLKTIVGELAAINGKMRWGNNMKIGYYAQHVMAMLNSNETVKSHLEKASPSDVSSQDIFEMAGNFLFKDESLKKEIKVLSGGERARLCLASLLLEKNHVLIMDEPTNHLDFETVEALADALKVTNSTVIFVSHNRTFVEILASGIIEVKDGTVRRYHHNYEDYVYHLQRRLESELESTQAPQKAKTHPQTPKQTPKQPQEKDLRIKQREVKKQLAKIERELEKIAKEKAELLKWFEENYTNFSQEKNERLALLTKMHSDLEAKWINLQS